MGRRGVGSPRTMARFGGVSKYSVICILNEGPSKLNRDSDLDKDLYLDLD